MDNRPVCRSFNYYVNPDSDSVVEHGTMLNPYKKLEYAFVEILNFHSHSDRNLTVNLMEGTNNYLMLQHAYIVDITDVEVTSYSSDSSADPAPATITAIDEDTLAATAGTSYNLMTDFTLNIAENIDDDTDISDAEKSQTTSNTYAFLILRSNFKLHNMILSSDYLSVTTMNIYFLPIYLQSMQFTLMDCEISVSGVILSTIDPANMHFENLNIGKHTFIITD